MQKPLIDIDATRAKLSSATGRMAQVWDLVRRLAHAHPDKNPWLTPFVALMERDPAMVQHARDAIAGHLDSAQEKAECGYLFNIWCFAFPHCRWAIWFDLLRQAGIYSDTEAEELAARFLLIQHRDHHAGLQVKPFPGCADNQVASLCLSSLVVGTLFADGPGDGHLARRLREESAPRLESMIGGMPPSGYSGEGSTYQGLIVAFATPFLLEMLERERGRDLFDTPLQPEGTSAADVLRMTSRLWMPGGLLLPWDDYGYQYGITAPLAYLAHRDGDRHCLALLEHEAPWSRVNAGSAGWGFDEVVWTLAWWPETAAPDLAWKPWTNGPVGGTLVDPPGRCYLMQMWDPTSPMCVRSQVNPNSLVLTVDGIPLMADGTPGAKCAALSFPGAVYERNFGAGAFQRMNLSKGCGGSHTCILVDGWEGFRPTHEDYAPSHLVESPDGQLVGDVTGLYRDAYPDCRVVRRRSTLVDNRFWLVEDLAAFEQPHNLDSRWYFRPGVTAAAGGIDLETPEGATLQMRSLLEPVTSSITRIEGFPRHPDGASDRVDVTTQTREGRWLWVLWPGEPRKPLTELTGGWRAGPVELDATCDLLAALPNSPVHPGDVPWLQADVPVTTAWGFHRTVDVPADQPWWLRLPRGLSTNVHLWIDGAPVPIPRSPAGLVPIHLPGPATDHGQVTVSLILDYCVGQGAKEENASWPNTPLAVCVAPTMPRLHKAVFADDHVTITATDGYAARISYTLMTIPEDAQ